MPMLNAPAADIEALLNKFPKERPQLSPEMATVHLSILKANRERTTALSKLSNLLESWMHRRIVSAAKSATMDKQARILEIGGGTLNHLKFESNIYHYDVIEPLNDHYDDKPQKSEVNNF
ncbi:MAG: hypothetical protein HQ503_11220, partial [Rhodospirillales bacterium]|nr:hypothetical protein [Rhodospirillales bacterium]